MQTSKEISKSLSKENHCTHLIAHGEPSLLHLGTGITFKEIENLANSFHVESQDTTRPSSIVIWGCEVGKGHIERQNSSHYFLHITDKKLGFGKTLDGYGELSKIIENSKIILSNDAWKSKGGTIISEIKPSLNKNKNLWVLQATNEIRFGTTVKGLGLQLNKNATIDGIFESSDNSFDSWTLTLNPSNSKLNLNLPQGLIKTNSQNYTVTINGKGKNIKSWNAELATWA